MNIASIRGTISPIILSPYPHDKQAVEIMKTPAQDQQVQNQFIEDKQKKQYRQSCIRRRNVYSMSTEYQKTKTIEISYRYGLTKLAQKLLANKDTILPPSGQFSKRSITSISNKFYVSKKYITKSEEIWNQRFGIYIETQYTANEKNAFFPIRFLVEKAKSVYCKLSEMTSRKNANAKQIGVICIYISLCNLIVHLNHKTINELGRYIQESKSLDRNNKQILICQIRAAMCFSIAISPPINFISLAQSYSILKKEGNVAGKVMSFVNSTFALETGFYKSSIENIKKPLWYIQIHQKIQSLENPLLRRTIKDEISEIRTRELISILQAKLNTKEKLGLNHLLYNSLIIAFEAVTQNRPRAINTYTQNHPIFTQNRKLAEECRDLWKFVQQKFWFRNSIIAAEDPDKILISRLTNFSNSNISEEMISLFGLRHRKKSL